MTSILKQFIRQILAEEIDIWGDDEPRQYKRIDGSTKRHGLHSAAHRMPDERHSIMMKNDVSKDAAIRADKLLDMHGIESDGPDQEMLKHIDANDEIGIALKRHAELETSAYLKFKRAFQARRNTFEQDLEKFKQKWENPPYDTWRTTELNSYQLSSSEGNTLQDLIEKMEEEFQKENQPFYVYRKTAENEPTRRITAWTTSSKGAWMGNSGHLKPNKKMLVDDLLAQGWMILGGLVRMMGAPGEGEITFIKF